MERDTGLIHAGRRPKEVHGAVNPPVYRMSTVIASTVAELNTRSQGRPDKTVTYGRRGTPTSFAFEEAIAATEGGRYAIATASGLSAISSTLIALLKAGDHILVTDSTYDPARYFCDTVLAGLGITTTYYDPRIGAGIAALIQPNTKVVYLESPGSLTFEVQDVPAIAAAAHAAGALVVADNTWGILSFRPFEKGVDVSLQACTKYVGGHADAMLGAIITVDDDLHLKIRQSFGAFGSAPGSEEVWLGLRGLRSLSARLDRQFAAGLRVAEWLSQRPEVAEVLHPALPSSRDHALWTRDFNGGCGLFGVVLKPPISKTAIAAMLDGYHYFGLGYSWGGFESLVVPAHQRRTAVTTPFAGPIIRYHIGLEAEGDLIADLEAGFARLAAAG